MESRPTIKNSGRPLHTTGASVLESADTELESADYTVDSAANALRIGLWVLALRQS